MLIVNKDYHYDEQPMVCDAKLVGTQGKRENVRGDCPLMLWGCTVRKCLLGMSGE